MSGCHLIESLGRSASAAACQRQPALNSTVSACCFVTRRLSTPVRPAHSPPVLLQRQRGVAGGRRRLGCAHRRRLPQLQSGVQPVPDSEGQLHQSMGAPAECNDLQAGRQRQRHLPGRTGQAVAQPRAGVLWPLGARNGIWGHSSWHAAQLSAPRQGRGGTWCRGHGRSRLLRGASPDQRVLAAGRPALRHEPARLHAAHLGGSSGGQQRQQRRHKGPGAAHAGRCLPGHPTGENSWAQLWIRSPVVLGGRSGLWRGGLALAARQGGGSSPPTRAAAAALQLHSLLYSAAMPCGSAATFLSRRARP